MPGGGRVLLSHYATPDRSHLAGGTSPIQCNLSDESLRRRTDAILKKLSGSASRLSLVVSIPLDNVTSFHAAQLLQVFFCDAERALCSVFWNNDHCAVRMRNDLLYRNCGHQLTTCQSVAIRSPIDGIQPG